MLREGDEVQVSLRPAMQEALAEVLNTTFDNIEFFFIEYTSEDYVTLSAETDESMAIICCPVASLETEYAQYRERVNELLNHIVNTHILDRALLTRDKELFQAVMTYNDTAQEDEDSPSYIQINEVIKMDEDGFYSESFDDIPFGDEK